MKKLFFVISLLLVVGMTGCSSNDPVIEKQEPELPGEEQNIELLGNKVGNLKDVEGIIHYNVTNNLWYIRKTTNDIEQEYYPLHIDIKFQRTPRKVTFSGETFEIPPSYVNYNKAECYAIKLTSINYRDSIYDLTGQLGDTVSVYGVNIPYRPLDPDSLPVWMRIYLDTPILTFILKGTKDDNLVYNIYTFASSSRYGWFFDKDKNYINVRNGEEYFMAVHDWECLYYRRILVK